ncbi:hypothetical protein GGR56DRAFT_687944 [Xylariaceae sp. FL0804]|nr:hypothetical protein GGR56DRAFT_687944 [Xylariaceae sp. FL0804]
MAVVEAPEAPRPTPVERDDIGNAAGPSSADSASAAAAAAAAAAAVEPVYSVFTDGQKRATVVLVSFVALVSPLSGAAYYPATQTLARDFDVSTTLIQLMSRNPGTGLCALTVAKAAVTRLGLGWAQVKTIREASGQGMIRMPCKGSPPAWRPA